jgi:hypothetical protein
MPPVSRSLADRFWPKVGKDGPVPAHQPELGPCWVWTKAVDRRGYGRLGAGGHDGGALAAHRVSWELAHGRIPDGLWVLHHCDNPPCVRPSHLFLGVHIDNVEDATQKGRLNRGVANNMARLNDDLVRQIRRRYDAGEGAASIARDLGFGLNTVWRVAVRQGWKHVADELGETPVPGRPGPRPGQARAL